jgi:predicted ribosomally synthesized peptide with SipW-like signal peptide
MGKKRIKQYLMLLLAIGVIAVVASGSGTFASFTAETTNANNTFATGTLFLHNTKDGGTTCTSESGTGNVQTSGCDTLFTVTNLAGNSTQTANLTLTNAGSLDSQNISFFAPGACSDSAAVIGTLNTAADETASTLKITGLTQTVVKDSKIQLDDGSDTNVYTVTTTTNAATAATTGIPVTTDSFTTASHSFPATSATKVTFKVGFTQTPNLCGQLKLYIEETDASFNTVLNCVYGTTTGAGQPCTDGPTLSSLPSSAQNFNNITTPQLAAGQSRYLKITVVTPTLGLSNSDQSTQAGFDLTWHIAA